MNLSSNIQNSFSNVQSPNISYRPIEQYNEITSNQLNITTSQSGSPQMQGVPQLVVQPGISPMATPSMQPTQQSYPSMQGVPPMGCSPSIQPVQQSGVSMQGVLPIGGQHPLHSVQQSAPKTEFQEQFQPGVPQPMLFQQHVNQVQGVPPQNVQFYQPVYQCLLPPTVQYIEYVPVYLYEPTKYVSNVSNVSSASQMHPRTNQHSFVPPETGSRDLASVLDVAGDKLAQEQVEKLEQKIGELEGKLSVMVEKKLKKFCGLL